MKITGIIVEYNPFHNGHIYHLQKARELTDADVLVAVMSGNWTQRGEPAVLSKWKRAKCACENGVDLVIELPFIYATQNADRFAYGAVRMLQNAGVDSIVFGSECGNLESLKEIAEIPFDTDRFRENMDAGYSYPKSYDIFTTQYGPNDILGISYLKQITNTDIQPYIIERTVPYFGDEIGEISSGQGIRNALLTGKDVRIATPMAGMIGYIPSWKDYYPYIRTLLLTMNPEELERRHMVSEGIENHLIKLAKKHPDYESFLNEAVTRRYTESRIRRILTKILTQTTKEAVENLPDMNYIRVLAYNDAGQEYLKVLRKKENLTVANKFIQVPKAYRDLEYKATCAYALGFPDEMREELMEEEVYGMHK
ncbi:MAG: nucleotidyltransferase family protein [Erysipelotrichales bacterium]|nr:nucleotidyltransferase family protein [Erysipelotrichales bacterium]